ncbi:zinc finger C2HC domain-containing protein 1C-like [Toxotes jaculatrix]|uniref:zinc finger C2HC domain-containing protein 1C-like n=1 Tax=Toxotes jaculatrix TaxID=941984 RepID=UPI001B3A7C0C|nr:zinc finger C2HC domain-containing protein 1C-like [Toxotes jaculatrix]
MSTYTRRRPRPQGQDNIAAQGNVYPQAQHGVVPGRRTDGIDRPFPNKPVSHRRPLNPRTKDSLDLYDFEKINVTKQPRGSFLPQEHNLSGIRETTGSQLPRKDSDGPPSGELQMARAIHAKELVLQEKLWRVEEKIRQKLQRDSVEAFAGMKNEEEKHNSGQAERGKAQTKTRLSEQHRQEAKSSRDILMQERRQERQEDVTQLRRNQDQRSKDRIQKTHEEEEARWKRRETEVAECPQSKRKGNKGTHNITVNHQKVSGELNKLRWENVKEYSRGKGDEKDHHIWGKAGVRPQDRVEKAKEREQNKTSLGNIGWTREKKYRERGYKDMHCTYDERDIPQVSQQKNAHRLAIENHGGAERKSRESSLPQLSSPSHPSRPQEDVLGLTDSTDGSFQLLLCGICNRKFASERLEKHIQICEKVNQSRRQVFNSYLNRTKGSAIEEFWKTHSISKTPEVLPKKNQRQNHKANAKNVQQGRLPAGTSHQKWSK